MNTCEVIEGLVERITFHHEENGFCVLKVKIKGRHAPKTKDDLTVVVGNCIRVCVGEWITATGVWHQDKNYGLQFKAATMTLIPPTTVDGMEKYLGSGLIKGIGPVYAKKMIQVFKNNVFDVIENHPEKLSHVDGIGPIRIEKIKAGWHAQKSIRTIMIFLHQYGISTTRAARIHKVYGDDAISIIQQNPYQLAKDIQGIGFVSADKMAEKLGISKSSLIRIRSGISYVLLDALGAGHCGLPISTLIKEGMKILDVDEDTVQDALTKELEEKNIIKDKIDNEDFIFLYGLYHNENYCAQELLNRVNMPCPWPRIKKDIIESVYEKSSIQLSDNQKRAVEKTLTSSVLVLTGGPGVGKTTILKCLLQILDQSGVHFLLAAPTGRAAKRMMSATGYESKTIHRLLHMNSQGGSYQKNADQALDTDLLVIDEASMIDIPLFTAVLKALPERAALLLVGDKDQLPSVGPGQVLNDIIASSSIPYVHLTDIFRQSACSQIIETAHQINQGIMPNLKPQGKSSDFFFLESEDAEAGLHTIIDLVKQRLPKHMGLCPFQDIQILCPMNHGFVGTRTLNMELQKAINPPDESSFTKYGTTFSVGDKIIQTCNNYDKDVYNGDVGIIQSIHSTEGEVMIAFDDRIISYDMSECDEISLAYALTIHKSQGSEYKAVIIPIFTTHYAMLYRNLIYTGITRGKKLVILVGQKKAMYIAIQNQTASKRWTRLSQKLSAKMLQAA